MAKMNDVPKAKIPGLYESKGDVGGEFPAFDKGEYYVEIDEFVEKETKAGNPMYSAKLIILDGPEQADDRNINGLTIFANYALQPPDHDYYKLSVDKLKNFLNAAGIKVDKAGNFAVRNGVGKKIWVKLSKKPGKDENGKLVPDKFFNNVEACYADDPDGNEV